LTGRAVFLGAGSRRRASGVPRPPLLQPAPPSEAVVPTRPSDGTRLRPMHRGDRVMCRLASAVARVDDRFRHGGGAALTNASATSRSPGRRSARDRSATRGVTTSQRGLVAQIVRYRPGRAIVSAQEATSVAIDADEHGRRRADRRMDRFGRENSLRHRGWVRQFAFRSWSTVCRVTSAEVIEEIGARLARAVPADSRIVLFGSRARGAG
jgi:hypothetical protein